MTTTAHDATALRQLIERMLLWLEPAVDDVSRCAICGWPLAGSAALGCVRGNCSSRPLPQRWYSPERAKSEYGGTLSEPTLTPLTFSLAADDVRCLLDALSPDVSREPPADLRRKAEAWDKVCAAGDDREAVWKAYCRERTNIALEPVLAESFLPAKDWQQCPECKSMWTRVESHQQTCSRFTGNYLATAPSPDPSTTE